MSSKVVAIPYEQYVKLKELCMKNELEVIDKDSTDTVLDKVADSHEHALNKDVISKPEDNISSKEKGDIKPIDSSYVSDDTLSEEEIVQFLPKIQQKKARLLLLHLKNNSILWDSSGRLIVDGECILDTHIVDLLSDILNNNKNNHKIPANSVSFLKLLRKLNCPRTILSKSLLKDEEEST